MCNHMAHLLTIRRLQVATYTFKSVFIVAVVCFGRINCLDTSVLCKCERELGMYVCRFRRVLSRGWGLMNAKGKTVGKFQFVVL